MSSRVHEEVGK